ncbi:MAG: NAD(P)/FAD-dependent oxidoreductase [Pseudanabaenaceae cyanobacterium]
MSPDWVVIGGGLTGAAIAWELQRAGAQVLLLDREPQVGGATAQSYGGLPHWSATTPFMAQLFAEAMALYPTLGENLGVEIGFAAIPLLLPTLPEDDPAALAAGFAAMACPPQWLEPAAARAIEPLLTGPITGAFGVEHAWVDLTALTQGYRAAMVRLGGEIRCATAKSPLTLPLQTTVGEIAAGAIALCAGGDSVGLLTDSGWSVPLGFTHSTALAVATDRRLQTFVMSPHLSRLRLERAGVPGTVVDMGAVPTACGVRLGQVSRLGDDREGTDPVLAIRAAVGAVLPAIADLPGTVLTCTVAFTPTGMPLVQPLTPQLYLFTGFTSPTLFVPPLARRFAQAVQGDRTAAEGLRIFGWPS